MRSTRFFAIGAAAAAFALLSGCASISEEECHTTDWRQRGQADGQGGVGQAALQDYLKICGKVGVAVNATAYRDGRNQGLKQYCTPQRGKEEGLSGRSYGNVCPPALEPGFLKTYSAAQQVYQAEQRLNNISYEIQDKERRLKKTDDPYKRRRLRDEIYSLDRESRMARDRVNDADRRLRENY